MNITNATDKADSGGLLGGRDRRPWVETPLDTESNCIRVLHLRKGSGEMPIICDLEVVSLDADPSYEVLSYVWGDPEDTKQITVGGVGFRVTAGLSDFMHCLRLPAGDRCIWADAICIDQLNEAEKSYQIGLMTKVYRQATEAHIWFGPFNSSSWYVDIAHDKSYTLACKLTPDMWKAYEDTCTSDLKYYVEQEGFKPLSCAEHAEFVRRCHDDRFLEALATLDKMADGEHLYTYPVFTCSNTSGSNRQYSVNRSWLWIMDVIRWLLIRPWWSRVWTLQEAVLPRVDPTVHAPPYSFKLSLLLNGIQSMLRHNGSTCCKWFGRTIMTTDRDYRSGQHYTQPLFMFQQREEMVDAPQEGMGVPLELVISAIQGRKATEIRDHWFGIFGLLPLQWQEGLKLFTAHCTTAELFSLCSKLLFIESEDLTILDLARRTKRSQISDLPSWAIDLSAQRSDNEEDYLRWKLYNATPDTKYDPVTDWPDVKTPELSVQGIRIETVQACAEHTLPKPYASLDVLQLVKKWLKLYRSISRRVADENAFWRAAFMDRNVQIH